MYYRHSEANQKCPDYHDVLIFQVIIFWPSFKCLVSLFSSVLLTDFTVKLGDISNFTQIVNF